MKKRILFVNEASFLNTGFSNMGHEFIKRLFATNKYEIAELGTYVSPEDPRIASIPWKFYAAQPSQGDKQGWEAYNQPSNQWGKMAHLGQFGQWALTNVLLDFQPDFVVGWMDFWMSTVVADSPLRKMYKHIYMPCIDSTPLRSEWLQMMENCDYLTAYSMFAYNVMNEQSPKIKTAGFKKLLPHPTRPGVDMNIFKPLDKKIIREKWHIKEDLPVILTCMRNQGRKLYCELLESFAKYKKDNLNDPTAQKAVLLIHSSAYDAGQEYWLQIYRLSELKYMKHHFPGLIKDVLHTFMCDSCGSRHIDYAIKLLNPQFRNGGAYIQCSVCGQWAAKAPNTNHGYSRQEMAEVFNLANLYVQVSVAGADEMPITEAKACGVPVLASANAAMEEKTIKIQEKNADGTPFTMHLGGIPVNIAYTFTDPGTMQNRSYFDKSDLAKKMQILSNTQKLEDLSKDALVAVKENCNYDNIVKRWEYVFDNLSTKDRATTWDKQIDTSTLMLDPITISNSISDEEFIDLCYTKILKSEIDVVGRVTWLNGLKAGQPRQDVVQYFLNVAQKDKMPELLLHNFRQAKTVKLVDINELKGLIC